MNAVAHAGQSGNAARFAVPVLVLVTIAVYCVSLGNGFVSDDEVIIVNNPQTLSPGSIPEVLFSPDVIKPYYRPLNRATYVLDYQLFGMNPVWYHAVNILIHTGNVLLLFLLCRRLLTDGGAALMVALIFAVHPANSEAVNFVSARNTLLALFFCLASLLAFLDAREKGKTLPLVSAFLYFCGLLCKETAFMLIAAIALCTFIRLPDSVERVNWKGRMFLLSPYLFLAAVYFAMRAYSLEGVVGTGIPAAGLLGRVASNYYVIPQYLKLLLFPVGLTMFHTVPRGGLLSPPWFLPAWLGLLAVVWLVLRSRNKVALFGLAWSVINYVPISNIVPIPSDQITERYLYMPAVGFFIAFGVLLYWLRARHRDSKTVWGVTAAIAVVFAALTVQRSLDWKDNVSLFASGVRNNPLSTAAHYNLGTALMEAGDMGSARLEWEKALALDPTYADALTQMGTLAAVQGDLAKAEQYYVAALQAPVGVTDPDKSMAHYNLGKIYEKWHKPELALQHYRRFLETVPITYLGYKPDAERRIASLRASLPESPSDGTKRQTKR